MVENIFRELGEREGTSYDLRRSSWPPPRMSIDPSSTRRRHHRRLPAHLCAHRPVRSSSNPMADTVSIALFGALILTLTFVPVLCCVWFKKGVHERVNKPFDGSAATRATRLVPQPSEDDDAGGYLDLRRDPSSHALHRRRVHAPSRRGRALVRPPCPTPSLLKKPPLLARGAQDPHAVPHGHDVGSELGRPDDGTDPTGFFNDEFYVGLKPYEELLEVRPD